MNSIFYLKLLLALLILSTTLLAGWYPFKKHLDNNKGYDFPIGESLACGVFLGASLLHMLSDSTNQFVAEGIVYPLSALLAGIIFLFFLWLEHLGREYYHTSQHDVSCFAFIAVVMLSIHSVLAGTALGLSEDLRVTSILFLAIVAHKWAASFAVAIYLNKSQISRRLTKMVFLFFAIMTPIGILFGATIQFYLRRHVLLTPIFESLAAGTFLYLGTLHGLERGVLVKQCCNLKNFSFVIVGFLLMAVIASYA